MMTDLPHAHYRHSDRWLRVYVPPVIVHLICVDVEVLWLYNHTEWLKSFYVSYLNVHVLVLLDDIKVVGTNWWNNASSFCWMFNINNVLLIEMKYSINIKDRLDFGVWSVCIFSETQILFLYFVVHVDRIFISLSKWTIDRINVRLQKQWQLGSPIYLGKIYLCQTTGTWTHFVCVVADKDGLTLSVILLFFP